MINTSFDQSAALAPVVAELNQGNDRATSFALGELARSRQLQDQEAGRRFVTERDKSAEKRAEERMRRQRILELAAKGVELPDDASARDIAKAERDHLTKRANLVIASHESDLASNDSEYQEAYKDLLSLAGSSSSIEEKRQAVQSLLMSPEVTKTLNDTQIKRLRESLVKGDPMEAVQKVASDVGGDYWFFPGKNPAKAQAIIDAFNAPLMEATSTRRQIKYKALTDKLNDISDNRKVIQRAMSQSYRDNAEFLDADVLKRGEKTVGYTPPQKEVFVPDDPNATLTDIAKPTAPTKSSKPVSQTIEEKGLVGALGEVDPMNTPIAPLVAGVNAFVPGTPQNAAVAEGVAALPKVGKNLLFGNPNTQPVTLKQLNAHRSSIGKKPVNSLNVEEARKFLASLPPDQHNAIRAQASNIGMSPEEIQAGDKLVQVGDLNDPRTQKAIMSGLLLYQMVTGQIGQTPPIQDEPMAPLPQ